MKAITHFSHWPPQVALAYCNYPRSTIYLDKPAIQVASLGYFDQNLNSIRRWQTRPLLDATLNVSIAKQKRCQHCHSAWIPATSNPLPLRSVSKHQLNRPLFRPGLYLIRSYNWKGCKYTRKCCHTHQCLECCRPHPLVQYQWHSHPPASQMAPPILSHSNLPYPPTNMYLNC